MNERNSKMELLGSVPIPKALLAMGLPTMIGMMINALYNLVDAYFVGGLGTSQMGAISVGAAIIICTILFLRPILRLLGATESILPYAEIYAGIYVVSSIFNIFNVTMNNIVTSEGAAKTTMCALLTGAVLNMVLDSVFIYVLHLGVAGAAIATAISQIVSTAVYLCYVFRKKSVFSFSIKKCCFSSEIMSEILKIGIPTLVFQLLTSLSVALINLKARPYGDSVIAGMGAVTRIISMGSLMVFGFLKGFQPIAGYSYGAKKYDRLHEAIKTSIIWSTIFCAVFGLGMALCSTAGVRWRQTVFLFCSSVSIPSILPCSSLWEKRKKALYSVPADRESALCLSYCFSQPSGSQTSHRSRCFLTLAAVAGWTCQHVRPARCSRE